MAPKRTSNKLSALDVKRLKSGMHPDGNNLYLEVAADSPSRSWVYRYTSPTQVYGEGRKMVGKPKVRYYFIGTTHLFGLAQAREEAKRLGRLVKSGVDILDQREEERRGARLETAKAITFKNAVEEYIKANRNSWRTDKHEKQWRSLMENYAYPTIGKLSVASIEDEHIRQILTPIWHEKLETSRRVRSYTEAVLERETHLKHRKGDNPARIGIVKTALGKQVSTVNHMPALPYTEVGAFLATVREREGVAAKALEFTILTAARTNETIGAQWDEVDLKKLIWTIPAERMKVLREHRVPLSKDATRILEVMKEVKISNFVFPGSRKGKHISNMAMLQLLKRMERTDITVHGFRSTFRDWCAEQTNYAREVAESSLAHTISDAVEAAYRRGDLFGKRSRLMAEWASHCNKPAVTADVVPIRKKK
jgi:integrase